LGYFSVLYPFLNNVYLYNTAMPTPSVLLAAQTANPQCNFSVDTSYVFTTFRANGSNQFNSTLVFPTSNPDPMVVDWGDGSTQSFYNTNKKKGGYGLRIVKSD
jgi:hypothetical protein